ncbi:holo-ACP synthase [Oscillatoria salina]|uniref:holo-ACP synthase n=1 Tax=Oscillatoria salina TaxID=331517 RepID=UPI0013BA1F2F|nr:4'-phosphopantetheinyl transferase superfamily protein [Oscillatoria salina]MBZ8179860.1 4'-phosphopantetheinyl transferase superfamily protein [Oscillatoria salina IIICB1]NET87116.1 4'-phosphopantetheinyl transferase superfamily protein [Kamptonema sp. SIO1D9]
MLQFESKIAVKGIGIDITSIERISRLIERYDRQTLALLFAEKEINFCQLTSNPQQAYALCFAAKEAVAKALGTGLAEMDWNEIEVQIMPEKLTINLSGQATTQAEKRGIKNWLVTWFSWDNHVLVHVVAI